MEEETPKDHKYFDKVEFLNQCQKVYAYTAYFRFRFGPTLLCKNITLAEDDILSFKFEDFHISREENVVFEGCNLGPVNCDFFRQFPSTKNLLFYNCKMEFKPSMLRIENNTIETLAIHSSKVKGNRFTNALQALPNLKVLVFYETDFESSIIDSDLLKENRKLEDITIAKCNVEVEENVLDNATELKSVYLSGFNMNSWNPRLIEKNKKIRSLTLYEPLATFPQDLPDTIKDLSLTYTLFRKLTREDMSKFKDLETLSICQGKLETIEEDALDDLKELMFINLNSNQIEHLTTRHIQFCKGLQEILLVGNPMKSFSLLGDGSTLNIKLGKSMTDSPESDEHGWTARSIEIRKKMRRMKLYEPMATFPQDLPEYTRDLSLFYTLFRTLTRDDLSKYKNLETLSICQGKLKTIEENALDDLKELIYINFDANQIENFSTRHIQCCKNLEEIVLNGNPLKTFALLGDGTTLNIKLGY